MKEFKVKCRDKCYKVKAEDSNAAASKVFTKVSREKKNQYSVKFKDRNFIVSATSRRDAANKLYNSMKMKDSAKLKELAYQLAQMGNYFDRANSINSRNILAREDSTKLVEFYKLAVQTYNQLKMELEAMKKVGIPRTPVFDTETGNLLRDAVSRLYWTNDSKCKMIGEKLRVLVKEYGKLVG